MSLEPSNVSSQSPSAATPLLRVASPSVAPARLAVSKTGQSLLLLSLAFASYLAISHFFVQSVRVSGVSMLPTLADSRFYLLNRWVYYVRAPRRGEVVVIRDPLDNGFSVKRVVGLGGDQVVLRSGKVYLNGRELTEPYLSPGTRTFGSKLADETYQCGPEDYFLLGDNRNCSLDSRAYGPVPRSRIMGLIVH